MDLNSKYFKSFIENIHVDKGKILGLSPLL
jgi:hypothetical protein